jgi:hypothetical protein
VTNIADLEATLKLVLTGDNDALSRLKLFQQNYDAFIEKTQRTPPSLARLEDNKAGRQTLLDAAQTLKSNIDATAERLVEMASGLQKAGIPLSNLIPLAIALKDQMGLVDAYILKAYDDYSRLTQFMKGKPVIGNENGFKQLQVNHTSQGNLTSLGDSLLRAWRAGSDLEKSLSSAGEKYRSLLQSQQQNSSTESFFKKSTADVDTATTKLLRFTQLLSDVKKQNEDFASSVDRVMSAVGPRVSATVTSMIGAMYNLDTALDTTTKRLQQMQALAATVSGPTRLSAAAKEARDAAQVALEQEKAASAARIQAMRAQAAEMKAAVELEKAKEVAVRAAADAAQKAAAAELKAAEAAKAGAQTAAEIVRTKTAASAATKTYADHLSNLGNWTQIAGGHLANFLYRIQSLQMALQQSSVGAVAFIGSFSGMIEKTLSFITAAKNVELTLGTVRTMHTSIADTLAVGRQAYTDLIDKMQKYGMSIEGLSKPIARMKVALKEMNDDLALKDIMPDVNMTWEQYKDKVKAAGEESSRAFLDLKAQIGSLSNAKFTGFLDDFGAIASKFALTQQGIQGVALAIDEMASKGTVHAKELIRQIGNYLPGATSTALMAYREMTGNQEATFAQFFSAMRGNAVKTDDFLRVWFQKIKQTYNIDNVASDNLQTANNRITTSFSIMISKMDEAFGITNRLKTVFKAVADALDWIGANARIVVPVLGGVATAMGVIAAISLINVLKQFETVATVVAGLGNAVASLKTKLGLLIAVAVVAGGAIALMSDGAKAAELGVDPLLAKVTALTEEAQQAGGSFAKLTEVRTSMDHLTSKIQETRTAIAQTEMNLFKLADMEKKWREDQAKAGNPAYDWAFATYAGAQGYKTAATYRDELERLKQTLGKLEASEGTLAAVQERLNALQAEGARIQASEAEQTAEKVAAAGRRLDEEASKAQGALTRLRVDGVEKFKYDQEIASVMQRLAGDVLALGANASVSAQEMEKLRAKAMQIVDAQRAQAAAFKAEEDARRKAASEKKREDAGLRGGDLSKYFGIINSAEAQMEGFGAKTGNALKQMNKSLLDYQDALVATAGKVNTVDAEEKRLIETHKLTAEQLDAIKAKVAEYKNVLEMQAAGLNLASLQLKPLAAMQKGLESFSDSLADLLVKGQLNSKNFAQAFSTMALSISKDIVAMIIKANILRPLLGSIWGAGGSSLFGSGGSLGTQPLSFFAKGDVFDQATAFPMQGGRTGVMGEAGPEAVMPLRRGPDGSLGVQMLGSSGGGSTYNVTYNVATPDVGGFVKSESQMAAMLTRATARGSRNG